MQEHSKPQQPSKRHKPQQRAKQSEATPYAILRAQSNLQELMPTLIGDKIPLAMGALQLQQGWTTSLWGEPIRLIEQSDPEARSHGTPWQQLLLPGTTPKTTTYGDRQVQRQGTTCTGQNQRRWRAGTQKSCQAQTQRKRPWGSPEDDDAMPTRWRTRQHRELRHDRGPPQRHEGLSRQRAVKATRVSLHSA